MTPVYHVTLVRDVPQPLIGPMVSLPASDWSKLTPQSEPCLAIHIPDHYWLQSPSIEHIEPSHCCHDQAESSSQSGASVRVT